MVGCWVSSAAFCSGSCLARAIAASSCRAAAAMARGIGFSVVGSAWLFWMSAAIAKGRRGSSRSDWGDWSDSASSSVLVASVAGVGGSGSG